MNARPGESEAGRAITLTEFSARAEARLSRAPPGPDDPLSNPRGDHSLDPEGIAVAPELPHRRAAVLVPVVARPEGVGLLLTTRAAHLREHSGQVAFPGGKIDAGETDAEAALREAEEEIGLSRSAVRVLGYLDPYLSGTAFLVTPVVGLVAPDARLVLNRDEVDDAFEVPLGFFDSPERFQIRSRVWKGRQRHYYEIPFGERMIWGVTAGIVHNLHERLFS